MKTYTKEEHLNYYQQIYTYDIDEMKPIWYSNYLCSCLRDFKLKTNRAYENCKNCLGYGIPPIPWSELK